MSTPSATPSPEQPLVEVDIDLDQPATGWDQFEVSLPGFIKLVHRETEAVRIIPSRSPPSQWSTL